MWYYGPAVLPILAGSIVAMVSIKAPRFDWITGLDIKLMMALMSSGALKVSAKLDVECYTVFLFDIPM